MAPTRFGTDGVRGVANEELTAELALALGRAAARVLPARPSSSAATPGVRARCSRPPSRPAWPRRGPTSSTSACCRPPAWPPWPSRRERARRHDLGLAQPLRRQRHQAVQPARDEAARRGRGGDRARARRASWPTPTARRAARPATGWGASAPTPTPSTSTATHLVATSDGTPARRPAHRASTAPTARPATSRPGC